MTVRVPAKVNLHLQVQAPGADGFHALRTVFQAVSLFDEVTATAADGLSLAVEGAELPSGPANLAWRAATRLAAACGLAPDVNLRLRKAIPVAGGMAGGSADAAATLVACAALWGVSRDLQPLAAELGSDVAFPLLGRTALGEGRGEMLTALDSAELHWVFVPAEFGIGAGDAYRELDRLRATGSAPAMAAGPDALVAALPGGDVDAIARLLVNDLQPAALSLAPVLGETLARGTAAGAVAGIVSGSGPTCAFLCRTAAHAVEVAAAFPRAITAHGPVAGTAVIG